MNTRTVGLEKDCRDEPRRTRRVIEDAVHAILQNYQRQKVDIPAELTDMGVEQFPSQNQHSFRHRRENAFGNLQLPVLVSPLSLASRKFFVRDPRLRCSKAILEGNQA
ncbi:MAG TPA: hypothetical protein VJ255_11415, partial [Candidatus Acidoferrum sp.]|nr:hypothetical protein [Candidatus Acidoferrum sp.]